MKRHFPPVCPYSGIPIISGSMNPEVRKDFIGLIKPAPCKDRITLIITNGEAK